MPMFAFSMRGDAAIYASRLSLLLFRRVRHFESYRCMLVTHFTPMLYFILLFSIDAFFTYDASHERADKSCARRHA